MDCGNDNRDIFRSIRWFDWDGNASVTPVANGIDNETSIAVDPED